MSCITLTREPLAWLQDLIDEFIRTSPENTMSNAANEPAWDQAVLGLASGADPLFEAYKEHVADFHWTPAEAFAQAYPESPAKPEELSVIVWSLPKREVTKADNREAKDYPSERWVRTRVFGEKFNELLRDHVAGGLRAAGIQACAPIRLPQWARLDSPRYGFASKWSERHAAYAAGLGTFGLCDGLITRKGKAHRLGSVVARMSVSPTPRPYDDRHAYCLFYADGGCGECIARCPAGALSENGHDKLKCRAFVRGKVGEYYKAKHDLEVWGCGLCQTGVPCESMIPVKEFRNPQKRVRGPA